MPASAIENNSLAPISSVADSQELAPPRRNHIAALDGVRGLAVLIVFVFHYGGGTHSSFRPMQWFGFVNKGGWSGVVLFFVLSGFLITGILWDSYSDPHWWRKFFARRSLRIFPLYFLALILVVLAAVPGGTASIVLSRIWIPVLFLEDVPYLNRIAETLPSPLPIFHLWSIAVEEQFYLVWPAVLFWCWRRSASSRIVAKRLCLGIFCGAFLFRAAIWFFYGDPRSFEHFLIAQSGALAAGGWLALAYRGPEWPRVLRFAPWSAVAGALGFAAVGVFARSFETSSGAPMMIVGLTFVTILYAGLLPLAMEPGLLRNFFSMAWLRWFGNISYGVYIFHVLLGGLAHSVTGRLVGNRGLMVFNAVQILVILCFSLAAATLSYHLYEKQFLRLKKYFVPAPKRRPTPDGA